MLECLDSAGRRAVGRLYRTLIGSVWAAACRETTHSRAGARRRSESFGRSGGKRIAQGCEEVHGKELSSRVAKVCVMRVEYVGRKLRVRVGRRRVGLE